MKKLVFTMLLATLSGQVLAEQETMPALPEFPSLLNRKNIPLNEKEWNSLKMVKRLVVVTITSKKINAYVV